MNHRNSDRSEEDIVKELIIPSWKKDTANKQDQLGGYTRSAYVPFYRRSMNKLEDTPVKRTQPSLIPRSCNSSTAASIMPGSSASITANVKPSSEEFRPKSYHEKIWMKKEGSSSSSAFKK